MSFITAAFYVRMAFGGATGSSPAYTVAADVARASSAFFSPVCVRALRRAGRVANQSVLAYDRLPKRLRTGE